MVRTEGSDEIVFEVDGRTIKCRKSLLMQKSEYLREYLVKNASSTRICISNVPYESCEVVMRWMHSTDTIASFVGEACSTPKLQKIWELSLRFAVVDVAAYCVEELKHRVHVENVCGFISTLYRYPSVPANIRVLNNDLKAFCLDFVVKHQEEVQKTPAYFAVMGVNAKIKADIEAALQAGPSADRHVPPMPPAARKGTAALLSKLKESNVASPAGKQPPIPYATSPPSHAVPHPQLPPQPSSAVTTPSHKPYAHPADPPASARPPSVANSDVNEPVYEHGQGSNPVFSHAGADQDAAQAIYDAQPLPEPEEASIPPSRSQGQGTPVTQPSRPGASGAGRLKRVLGTASSGHAVPAGDLSPTPQPPVSSKPSPADNVVSLVVEEAVRPLAKGTRLATCAEAHAQRKLLRDFMDDIDGGFLASFELADGKVDGPGYGVPLRFATGKFAALQMRVVVRDDAQPAAWGPDRSTRPKALFHDTSAHTDGTPAGGRSDEPRGGFDTERDSILLKHYKLQQEVRVTSHELELFKNDFLDWETSLNQTNALRDVEEKKLRQRILQQKRQLVRSMYGEALTEADSSETVYPSQIEREKEELEGVLRDLRTMKESHKVQCLHAEAEKVRGEISKLENVRGLIDTELAENEQYEGYSKRYVCAVKTAEHELADILAHQEPSAARMEQLLEAISHEKNEHGREVSELENRTRHLSKRIATECSHIKHIRTFLDETEQEPRSAMGQSKKKSSRLPSFFRLPESTEKKSDVALACSLLEGVVWCNRNATLDVKNDAKIFVSHTDQRRAVPLTEFMKFVCGDLLPKTWPCILWIVDAVSKRLGVPVCPRTVRRLVTGAAYLLLSTEDDAGVPELCGRTGKRELKLERLSSRILGALKLEKEFAGSETDETEWEELIGLHHAGWVRTTLPILARHADKEVNKRAIHSDVLITPMQHEIAHIIPDGGSAGGRPNSLDSETVAMGSLQYRLRSFTKVDSSSTLSIGMSLTPSSSIRTLVSVESQQDCSSTERDGCPAARSVARRLLAAQEYSLSQSSLVSTPRSSTTQGKVSL